MGLPVLKFLLQSSAIVITMKRVVTMLKPNFSAEGSNAIQYEKDVYGLFIKYMREVTGIFLSHRIHLKYVLPMKDTFYKKSNLT